MHVSILALFPPVFLLCGSSDESDVGVSTAVATARADEFQCPDNSTAIRRLKSHVFCNYDPYIRPVRWYNETVDVRLRLVLKKIHFVSIHVSGSYYF